MTYAVGQFILIMLTLLCMLPTGCIANRAGGEKTAPESLQQDTTAARDSVLRTGWYYVVEAGNGYERQLDKSTETYTIDPVPIVTTAHFTALELYEGGVKEQRYHGLMIRLDEDGTERWGHATARSVNRLLAFILDDQLLHIAVVNSQITSGVTTLNRAIYTVQELEAIKAAIEQER